KRASPRRRGAFGSAGAVSSTTAVRGAGTRRGAAPSPRWRACVGFGEALAGFFPGGVAVRWPIGVRPRGAAPRADAPAPLAATAGTKDVGQVVHTRGLGEPVDGGADVVARQQLVDEAARPTEYDVAHGGAVGADHQAGSPERRNLFGQRQLARHNCLHALPF